MENIMDDFFFKLDEALIIMEDIQAKVKSIYDDLDSTQIPYVVVGGMAVAHHGWPRFTRDVDILVNDEDIKSICTKGNLEAFQIDVDFVFTTHKGTGIKVDILRGGTIFPRIENVERSKSDPRVIAIEDLIAIKMRRGDPSDIGDIWKISKLCPPNWDKVKSKVTPKAWTMIEKTILVYLK